MTSAAIRPISTRSALLSILLGAEVPRLSARELVRGGALVGFTEQAVRTALSRMVTAGDLVRDGSGAYSLAERLRARQERQEQAIHPPLVPWSGDWEQLVVTNTGRSAAERTALRTRMTVLRFGELREGVWTRPANLRIDWPDDSSGVGDRFLVRPSGDPGELAARLWGLDDWADTARALLAATSADDPAERFAACATSVRHLLADPVLPVGLLPAEWPGEELRRSHLDYRAWLRAMRREAVAS